MKESAIRDYISRIDFKNSDWSIYKMSEDMKRFLGEKPAINVIYEKNISINEFSSEVKEFMDINKVQIIFTDLDEKIKKIEFLID